jgi:ABC-type multidrug transport system permease subunit
MKTIWLLTKKNLKLLIRSRSSALIVILAPLLLMLILGLSYDTNERFSLSIGVYSSEFTEPVNNFITLLQEDFNIIKYDNSEQCIKDIAHGNTHSCIELPPDFTIAKNTQKEIIFHIDPSRVNLVYSIQQAVASKFDLKSQEMSESLTNNILTLLTETNTKLTIRSNELNSVKEKSQNAISNAATTKSNLGEIDLAVPGNSHDTAILTSISGKVKDGIKKISTAKSDVSGSALTDEEKATITASLTSANKELNVVKNSLENSTGSIKALVAGLEKDLIVTQEKLIKASSSLSTASTSLGTVSTTLSEVESSLNNLKTSIDEMKSKLDNQKVTEAGVISQPLITTIKPVKEGTYLNFLFPALLVLIVMFSSLLLGTSLVMMEKNSPAYIRNYFVPARRFSFVTAIYLTNMILVLIEIIVILGIASIFLENIYQVLPLVIGILFIVASVFTLIGMGLGYLFTSEETGILASISLGSLLLFVSGLILPLEGLTAVMREIVQYNPFVIAEKLLREALIFQSNFAEISSQFTLIAGYAIGLFIFILLLESFLYKHLVKRFMQKHHRKHHHKPKKDLNE